MVMSERDPENFRNEVESISVIRFTGALELPLILKKMETLPDGSGLRVTLPLFLER